MSNNWMPSFGGDGVYSIILVVLAIMFGLAIWKLVELVIWFCSHIAWR